MTFYTRLFGQDVAAEGVDSLDCMCGKSLHRQQTHPTIHAPFQFLPASLVKKSSTCLPFDLSLHVHTRG